MLLLDAMCSKFGRDNIEIMKGNDVMYELRSAVRMV